MDISASKKVNENLVWDKYIFDCENVNGLSASEKKAAKNALTYLKELLGERFLQRIYNQQSLRAPHPLGFYILNQVAGTRLHLIKYVEALQAVQQSKNFKSLLKRFKDTENFTEGASVLEVALEFYRTGFQIEFDPEVFVTDQSGNSKLKHPDLKVTSKTTNETAIVEVSQLKQSDRWREASNVMNFISPLVWSESGSENLTIYAQLNSNFNVGRIEETSEKLRHLVAEVKRTRDLQTLVTDCIEAGIALSDNETPLKDWADSRGISHCISGPPVEYNELPRILEKIKGKLSQLPETLPGIIVIPANQSALFLHYNNDTDLIVDYISEHINNYPRIFCVVLSYRFISGEPDNSYASATPEFAFASRTAKGLTEQSLVVFNETCNISMSYALTQEIRRTFIYV